ncbi:Fe(3+) ABC transporter substrate-binding protein [Halalkalibacillus sediminis]|uniref:Fe(3+) ABC transporter substrate-binding protein n=1 Tax=Halalkalibacillus sediminis TaxID=2018042 RepID=A0A2I0QSF2_9BACI|nr:Fe(3+) ABC transporter substrate-binding protein [Halalkalibacillus sediminis]PKR77238.1 Fe(3+) ABC transporter substrate-binding protein [Halalkalibacillus sediminis]
MSKRKLSLIAFILLLSSLLLVACGNNDSSEDESDDTEGSESTGEENNDSEDSESTAEESGEVNLYTSRHYDIDDEIYAAFTEETGIEVNIINGSADELIERMKREGEATEADLFFTADAGRLHRAKEQDLLQPIESETLSANIPQKLRDQDNEWFGLTKRARVIVYHKDRVDESELSTYEALAEPEWEDRVLIRSSENIYNQSLLASMIEMNGRDEAKAWAEGIVENMGRTPQGGDRDQAKGVVAGEGDVAIMNTYYLGGMLNSADEEEVKVAEQLGIFFPNQDSTGTHVNVSGVGVAKHSKNKENAVQLIEYLSSKDAQHEFASANYEYPVNEDVAPADVLKDWGDFTEQDINLSILGENNAEAVRIFNEVDWK